jgi:hypothetical protein
MPLPRSVLAPLLLFSLCAPGQTPSVQILVQSSPLAGYRYGEAAAVWPLLRPAIRSELVREAENLYDANAVRGRLGADASSATCRGARTALAWGMDRGTPLRARVSRLVEHPNPARRIEFEVYLE